MIYDYYCVDCGNRFAAADICFDLAELLGIDIKVTDSVANKKVTGKTSMYSLNTGPLKTLFESRSDSEKKNIDGIEGKSKSAKSRLTQIHVTKLWELAQKKGVKLQHNKKVLLRITLMDFLKIMGENAEKDSGKGTLLAEKMASYKLSELEDALGNVFSTRGSQSENEQMKKEWQDAIKTRFSQLSYRAEEFIQKHKKDETYSDLIKKMRDNTANYEAGFWMKPEFFENGANNSIYTIQYSHNSREAFLKDIRAPYTIRGYCPKCGQPVIDGAGKYPHVLVGMLGAQSAGKTSLIMALIDELENSFSKYQISFPGAPLCDSRYDIMQENRILYNNGWAVRKTNALSNAGTFNVSFRITTKDKVITKLLTLVDIAGEQCYDLKNNRVNQEAFRNYPVIGQCSMYLLCSCINQNGYGNADGEFTVIPPNAVLQIAQQIYEMLPEKTKVPPLCILMTKADMAADNDGKKQAGNPFEEICPARNYEFASPLENIKLAYDRTRSQDIRQPLMWCKRAYDDMMGKTYITLLMCSALGRRGIRYSGSIEEIFPYREDGVIKPFQKTRMDDLWKWILQTAGLSPVGDTNKRLPFIPSYDERYVLPTSSRGKYYRATPESMGLRCSAVGILYLNRSNMDYQIIHELTKVRGRFGIKVDKALEKLVINQNIALR